MSSAMPVCSSVREVLLNTSASGGIKEATICRASSPVRARRARMPLRSSA